MDISTKPAWDKLSLTVEFPVKKYGSPANCGRVNTAKEPQRKQLMTCWSDCNLIISTAYISTILPGIIWVRGMTLKRHIVPERSELLESVTSTTTWTLSIRLWRRQKFDRRSCRLSVIRLRNVKRRGHWRHSMTCRWSAGIRSDMQIRISWRMKRLWPLRRLTGKA